MAELRYAVTERPMIMMLVAVKVARSIDKAREGSGYIVAHILIIRSFYSVRLAICCGCCWKSVISYAALLYSCRDIYSSGNFISYIMCVEDC